MLILRAVLTPKEADGAKAAAGAAKKRVARASFMLIILLDMNFIMVVCSEEDFLRFEEKITQRIRLTKHHHHKAVVRNQQQTEKSIVYLCIMYHVIHSSLGKMRTCCSKVLLLSLSRVYVLRLT